MKSSYSFEDRDTERRTDRQTEGINFGMYSKRPFRMIYDTLTKAEN